MHLEIERQHMESSELEMHMGKTVNKVSMQGPYDRMVAEKEGEDIRRPLPAGRHPGRRTVKQSPRPSRSPLPFSAQADPECVDGAVSGCGRRLRSAHL